MRRVAPGRHGAGGDPAGVGAPGARPRFPHLRRRARPLRGHPGRGPRRRGAALAGEAAAARVRGGGRRGRRAPVRRYPQPEDRHRRGRDRGAVHRGPERVEAPALPHLRGEPGLGGPPAEVPVPRPAAAADAAEPAAPAPGGAGRPPRPRRAGLPRDRDPDPRQVDAGGRSRLPGPQPGPSRRVLRPAAVAADLQADPDDLGHGPLLPDRPLLPRRGPARRPAARVHADRHGGVVRHPGRRLRHRRAPDARGVRGGRPSPSRRRSPG